MTNTPDYDLLIVGGGPAGSTAAIYAARANLKTLIIDKALSEGALAITHKIANYPGVEEELTGQELLDRMVRQAKSFGAEYVQKLVIGADITGDIKTIYTGTGDVYTGRALIAATGALGRGTSLPGEDEFLGRGVSYCATCDGAFYKDKVVAVAGEGDHAYEEALFLTRFAKQVHMLVPGKELKGDPGFAAALTGSPQVALQLQSRVTAIGGNGVVQSLTVRSPEGEAAIPVDGVFLYLKGNKPVTQWLGEALPTGESGCLLVDREMRTGIPGVWAVGDLLCTDLKQAVIAASDGCIAAMSVDKELNRRARMRKDYL